MAAPIQLATAYETLHGPNPGHYHFSADLIAYPADLLFPNPLELEYSPVFEPFSLEFGPYYYNDSEAETLFLLDCPPVYWLLVLARDPNRLLRIDHHHLVALFTASLPAFQTYIIAHVHGQAPMSPLPRPMAIQPFLALNPPTGSDITLPLGFCFLNSSEIPVVADSACPFTFGFYEFGLFRLLDKRIIHNVMPAIFQASSVYEPPYPSANNTSWMVVFPLLSLTSVTPELTLQQIDSQEDETFKTPPSPIVPLEGDPNKLDFPRKSKSQHTTRATPEIPVTPSGRGRRRTPHSDNLSLKGKAVDPAELAGRSPVVNPANLFDSKVVSVPASPAGRGHILRPPAPCSRSPANSRPSKRHKPHAKAPPAPPVVRISEDRDGEDFDPNAANRIPSNKRTGRPCKRVLYPCNIPSLLVDLPVAPQSLVAYPPSLGLISLRFRKIPRRLLKTLYIPEVMQQASTYRRSFPSVILLLPFMTGAVTTAMEAMVAVMVVVVEVVVLVHRPALPVVHPEVAPEVPAVPVVLVFQEVHPEAPLAVHLAVAPEVPVYLGPLVVLRRLKPTRP
ncbi:hypothetical protein DFH07DRAFT_951367 [Mycena maculata]|uniref:Uncharacterized protein n=1 Tax=Mycena maculata TaxID=230809 RepID=A0AAD7NUL5_9AGAR|nr:hypothetical protein DFH07DRAFT_951367 [Mycena maculata]